MISRYTRPQMGHIWTDENKFRMWLAVEVAATETLAEAVGRMLHYDIGRLPVVSRDDPRKLVGYLGRAGVMAARLRRHQEEHVREPGWLGRMGAG